MSYDYAEEREKIFTDDGQRDFLKVRDRANALLAEAGAFKIFAPMRNQRLGGDTWYQMALVDRLVELGEIREVTPGTVPGQDRVFVSVR